MYECVGVDISWKGRGREATWVPCRSLESLVGVWRDLVSRSSDGGLLSSICAGLLE